MAYTFTAGGSADPGEAPGTGDNGEIWDPTGGVGGTGVWRKPRAAQDAGPKYQFTPGAWGGQGNNIAADGTETAGTSGAAQDANRYAGMAKPTYNAGPQIDRTQSGETRDLSMGALGLLGQTAAGKTPSAAERLGTQMGQRAQYAQHSLGASVRGGAMARAAAARNATMNAGTIDAQTRQANAATRAGEMASAREGYLGAASGQRGMDIGLASSQAGLDVGQRSANDQREGYYEDLGQATKNAELGHQLGRTESDQNAANAARAQGQAEDAYKQQQATKVTNTVVGGATGMMQGWANSPDAKPAQTKSSDPWDPSNYSGSDERMKDSVVPLSEGEGTERHWDRDVSKAKGPDVTSGASLSGKAPRYGAALKAESQPAKASAPKTRKYSDAELEKLGKEMLGNTKAQSEAQLGAGPSTGHQPPAWLSNEMERGDNAMADANRSMAPFQYAYKPGFDAEAHQAPGEKNVGPMAQNMAANPVAATAIVERPDGMLAIDKDKGLKLTMGGLASVQQQLDELKKGARR